MKKKMRVKYKYNTPIHEKTCEGKPILHKRADLISSENPIKFCSNNYFSKGVCGMTTFA